MAKFKYIGEAPNGSFQMYGAEWRAGEVSEVNDPAFIAKLERNQFFERIDAEVTIEQPKKKGKGPRKEVANDHADTARAIESGNGEAGDH